MDQKFELYKWFGGSTNQSVYRKQRQAWHFR